MAQAVREKAELDAKYEPDCSPIFDYCDAVYGLTWKWFKWY